MKDFVVTIIIGLVALLFFGFFIIPVLSVFLWVEIELFDRLIIGATFVILFSLMAAFVKVVLERIKEIKEEKQHDISKY